MKTQKQMGLNGRLPIVSYLTDPESKAVSVRMVVKIPHRTTQERSSYLATFDQLTQSLFLNMFQARTTEATSKKDAPCKAIIPVFGEVVYACSTFSTTAVPKDSKSTLEALKSIVTEIEKVTKYGFEPEELEKSRARILRGIETLYKRSKESTNKDYVSAAVDHFTRDSPLLDIDANYKLSKELLHKITIEDINLAVERILSDKNRVIIFNAPESDKEYLPTEDEVLAMLGEVKYAYKEPELSKGEVTLRYMAPNMLSSKASVSRVYHHKVNYTSENKLIAKYITYILRDRYMHSIREEKGGTYHVGVVNELLDLPTPTLSFSIDFDTDPTLVDELLEIVQLEIDQLVKNGPTEKEMKEINLYLSKMHNESKKETNWANIIINALKGEEDLTSNEEKLINTMSLKEIHKFAKDFFKTTNRMTFIFEPIL